MILSSSKRSYDISLSPEVIESTLSGASKGDMRNVQDSIDFFFTQATNLSQSSKAGAWQEANVWRDKGKLLILFKEGFTDESLESLGNLDDLV